ncbi:MAG: sulfotransferase [Saprospiraceae bacterium]|nr:sulfotransferase [Lewinella sp.]
MPSSGTIFSEGGPMLPNTPQPLFVHGVQKTGTSTLVGMLNSHPQVFLLYETRMDKSVISKYGNQILAQLPEARKFFRNSLNIGEPYLNFASLLAEHNPKAHYRYIGDKIISLDPQETQRTIPHKVIYVLRDVRTWLCKEQIVRYYRTDLDVVPPAIDYLRYVIGSFQSPNALHIRLEDVILHNTDVFSQLSDFLGLDFSGYSDQYWKGVGQYEENDPKSYVRWFAGHPSSKVKPTGLDTQVEPLSHPFWQEYLPLFDKYFEAKSTAAFSLSDMNDDLCKLDTLMNYSPLPLEQCYKNISTKRLGLQRKSGILAGIRVALTGYPQLRSLLKKVLRRV